MNPSNCSKNNIEVQLYKLGWFFLIGGGISVLVYMKLVLPNVEIPSCIVYTILGIYCPGCGGTRSVDALLHGHILQSLWYHPLVLYTLVVFGIFMISHTLERLHIGKIRGLKYRDWHLYVALVIMVLNWIGKNILLHAFHITL